MAATAGPSRSPIADPTQNVATTRPPINIDATLDSAFTLLLQKSLQAEQEGVVKPATINFMWTGGGQALNLLTLDPIMVEIPFASTLVWAHMFAGDGVGGAIDVSATVELRLSNFANFGSSLPLYQTGLIPTLDTVASMDLDITDWLTNFDGGDIITAYPVTFTGTATWMALVLRLRPTESAIGVSATEDNSGEVMTTNDGEAMQFRA